MSTEFAENRRFQSRCSFCYLFADVVGLSSISRHYTSVLTIKLVFFAGFRGASTVL